MRRASYSLLWATVLASVALAPAGTAVAGSGTTTSAGDQQYLDPLASTTPSATPSPAPPTAAPSPPTATPPQPAPARRDPSRNHTLPYTGFNLWVLVWAGLGLIALGVLVRWLSRRSARPDAP